MKKISPEKALEISEKLDKFTWFSNPFWIHTDCVYEEKNGELLVYDVTDGEKTLLFLPKKISNMIDKEIYLVFREDLVRIKRLGLEIKNKNFVAKEFIYKIKDLVELKGSDYSSFRKNLNKFKRRSDYKILHKYPKEKILKFLDIWANQKSLEGKSETTAKYLKEDLWSCQGYTRVLDKIPHKAIFVEIAGKLAGFAVFCRLKSGLWIGVMQKVDYKYRGLTQFLYHEKAKMMSPGEYFTTGPEAEDPSLAKFKESLRPHKKLDIWGLILGNAKQ